MKNKVNLLSNVGIKSETMYRSQIVGLVEKADMSIFPSKSRHVDVSLEKPTRRFLLQKADTSIFR